MPAPQDEQFLSRLDRALKPDWPRRSRLQDELMDHVQARVEELCEQGYEHEAAWQFAESELGDLNEWVGLEEQVDHLNTRRQWMRFTTLTIIGGFVACTMLMSMWPENSRLAVIPRVSGQEEGGGRGVAGDPNRDAEQKLQKVMSFDFIEAPLEELVDGLRRDLGIAIYLDSDSLELEGIGADTEISLRLNDVKVATALEMIGKSLPGFGYYVRDGILVLTSSVAEEEEMFVRVYNVRDLIDRMAWSPRGPRGGAPGMMGPGGPGWGMGGAGGGPGAGGGAGFGGPGAGAGAGFGGPFGGAGGGNLPPAPQSIAPESPGSGASGGFPGAPGGGRGGNLPPAPQSTPPGLPGSGGGAPGSGGQPPKDVDGDPFGLQDDEPTAKPLRFRWVLAQTGLAQAGGTGIPGGLGGMGSGGGMPSPQPFDPEEKDLQQLRDIILETVAPDRWDRMGGTGSIAGMNGLLVIRQSYSIHADIRALLEQLEAAVRH